MVLEVASSALAAASGSSVVSPLGPKKSARMLLSTPSDAPAAAVEVRDGLGADQPAGTCDQNRFHAAFPLRTDDVIANRVVGILLLELSAGSRGRVTHGPNTVSTGFPRHFDESRRPASSRPLKNRPPLSTRGPGNVSTSRE